MESFLMRKKDAWVLDFSEGHQHINILELQAEQNFKWVLQRFSDEFSIVSYHPRHSIINVGNSPNSSYYNAASLTTYS